MTAVVFANETYPVSDGESVLDTLLAAGHEIAHGCRSGVCQSCLMKASEGAVPESAQKGLKETLKAQGYFLACQCQPESQLSIQTPDQQSFRLPAQVTAVRRLNADVAVIRLQPEQPMDYQPGQFITLFRDASLGRSYSLSSVPHEDGDELELHVRAIPDGQLSPWLYEALEPGMEVAIQGPSGNCFYTPDDRAQALLLMGTGTGLAPLYGIAREALHQGHQGDIHLFHGALNMDGLYFDARLNNLAKAAERLHYHPCVLGEGDDSVHSGKVDDYALEQFPDLSGWKAFLCGDEAFVNQARRRCFLAGANMNAIYADAFVSSG